MQNATTDDWDEKDDLPLSELKQIWTTYRTAMGTDNVSFDDYVDIDDGVQTMGFPTDEDILDSVMENLVPSGKDLEEEVSSESEVETTTETIPTFNQAIYLLFCYPDPKKFYFVKRKCSQCSTCVNKCSGTFYREREMVRI
ncbi:uncharacterized protein LOC125775591 [Bactrocera dorsalis]|uniref:Uncharacterized protein LOC125775591 n=1 Tax=Bactrocera dorsalis TaxID=27457 RepID=A0ABM3IZ87_BACDO|nr:uncharacterized protein LOC125775591 [Bactrocera dorsalis]